MVRRWHVPLLGLFAWVALSGAPIGQTGSTSPSTTGATITGRVVDSKRAPLAGVSLRLELNGTTTTTSVSDAEGRFRFAGVKPGAYQLRAELTGFAAFVRDVAVQSVGDTLHEAIVMTRVSAAATDAEAVGTKLDSVQVTNLPLDGYRNYQALVVMTPDPNSYVAGAPTVEGVLPAAPAAGRAGRGGQNLTDGARSVNLWNPAEPGPYGLPPNTESYAGVRPHRFNRTSDEPLSTFGADVDTASYANVRRFLSDGQLPPSAAVRVEEFVNYFRFPYAEPRGSHPIAVMTEVGDAPWAPGHKLVLIGARARASSRREIEGRNIVLLIDVSGSMAPPDKLPLIKSALAMFVDTLDPDDRIAIVTYAGTTGVALPSTPGRQRDVIQRAIAGLNSGGSTNGGQGLRLAYDIARRAFIRGGVNRVILATDGDFNVGVVSQHDLLRLIEHERESGVFLSVFGVGTGNLKDSTMELLADHGNGQYAYLDSLQEARRVLIREGNATLETVAKDVKFQVEFNPAMVAAWRQIGYENRALAAEDFNNDRKDAGEMGAGHTVTALYEIIPVGVDVDEREERDDRPGVDPLRYQPQPAPPARRPAATTVASTSGEWLRVKARYKLPDGQDSRVFEQPVRSGGREQHLPLASAVAEFGLLLRDGPRHSERWEALARRVSRLNPPAALAADVHEMAELIGLARALAR
jgi:Ca-activated chloride channel family protein